MRERRQVFHDAPIIHADVIAREHVAVCVALAERIRPRTDIARLVLAALTFVVVVTPSDGIADATVEFAGVARLSLLATVRTALRVGAAARTAVIGTCTARFTCLQIADAVSAAELVFVVHSVLEAGDVVAVLELHHVLVAGLGADRRLVADVRADGGRRRRRQVPAALEVDERSDDDDEVTYVSHLTHDDALSLSARVTQLPAEVSRASMAA